MSELPDEVYSSAQAIAEENNETLVGWKPIRADEPIGGGNIYPIVSWMVITNKGYYEVTFQGLCVRAAVLYPFPAKDE